MKSSRESSICLMKKSAVNRMVSNPSAMFTVRKTILNADVSDLLHPIDLEVELIVVLVVWIARVESSCGVNI